MGQAIGLLRQRQRQTRLFEDHRHGFRLRAAPSGSDGGAVYRLRQNMFGKLQERLALLVCRGFIRFLGYRLQRDLRQGMATFQLLKIVKDRLLDQPVWGAVNLACRQLNALARGFIQLHAHGSCAHA